MIVFNCKLIWIKPILQKSLTPSTLNTLRVRMNIKEKVAKPLKMQKACTLLIHWVQIKISLHKFGPKAKQKQVLFGFQPLTKQIKKQHRNFI